MSALNAEDILLNLLLIVGFDCMAIAIMAQRKRTATGEIDLIIVNYGKFFGISDLADIKNAWE